MEPIESIVNALQIQVNVESFNNMSLGTTEWLATATLLSEVETFHGFGTDSLLDIAYKKAALECVERYAQFTRDTSRLSILAEPYLAVQDEALFPPTFGLYSPAQYTLPDFALVPFTERLHLHWVQIENLHTHGRYFVPSDFIYPRLNLHGSVIVAETSSGTAAHFNKESALVAAVCEIIERDSLMLFWYRQPPTPIIPVSMLPVSTFRNQLHYLQQRGFIVSVCDLRYDLDVPCLLIIALQGSKLAYGLGCHPDWQKALHHAISELYQSIHGLNSTTKRPNKLLFTHQVHKPIDHYNLYNNGPFHEVFRGVLAHVLHVQPESYWDLLFTEAQPLYESMLTNVLIKLANRGYQAYVCDCVPPELRHYDAYIVRVVIPGLIPIHFGHNRLRLGCERLWAAGYPGRLTTLLPHFIS